MKAGYVDYGYRSGEGAHTSAYLLPHLERLLGREPGSVLDLGCGNGAVALRLIAKGFDVYGVDASESGIAIANRSAQGRFHVMDLSERQLPAALATLQFSHVISTEVIEHLYDPRALLATAHTLLAPRRGTLILSTPYHGYLKNLGLALTGKMDGHFTALWSGGHIKFFSRATLSQLLLEEGFRTIDFAGAGRLPWLWKSMLLKAQAN